MTTTFLDPEVSRAHRAQNQQHTFLLLAGLSAILAVPTVLITGFTGLIVIAGFVAALYVGAQRIPPRAIMRAYDGRLVTEQSSAQLSHIVDVLTARAELTSRPALYVIPSLTLNAFATGRADNAAIAITEGLLRKLDIREIAGVLAHEISHIRNNDLQVMALADIISRIVQLLSYLALFLLIANVFSMIADGEPHISWIAIALLYAAPTLSSLLQLGLSRTREYDADLEAAYLTGDPSWLASALRDLERHTGSFWEDLMMPVPGRRIPQPSLLRTHPRTEDRIRRLAALDTRMSQPMAVREEPFISTIGLGPISMRPRYRFPGVWF